MQDFLNYIGGQWVIAEDKESFAKFNPFNGQLLGHVTSSNAMDVIKALPHAKKSQQDFEKTTLADRAQLLTRMADVLEQNADRYALLEATQQGLPRKFVREKSVLAAVYFFRKAAQDCQHAESIHHLCLPVGIVSIISSWCLSLRLISERLAPALAAGNAVLIKISELSPVTALILAEVFESAQLPAGLVQIFQGKGSDVGSVLAAHPSIRAVSFVGQPGESVLKAATASYKKIQIAGGAKNSSFILNETDFKSQLPLILESFLIGQGQLCWNTHRLFILDSMAAEFVASLQQLLNQLKPATGPDSETLWWPVIEHGIVTKTQEKIQLAQQEHAKIIASTENSHTSGFFVKPSFTLDLTNCSVLQQDEIHAPLFIITPVKYLHDMIKWSNTGYLGHSAIIWGPAGKTQKPAQALHCSYVWTNGWLVNYDPISGHKHSSFGNMDLNPFGSFFSDVKKVTAPE